MSNFLLLQSNKPIMEKRRRARINNCLNELKALILDAMKKDVSILCEYVIGTQVCLLNVKRCKSYKFRHISQALKLK